MKMCSAIVGLILMASTLHAAEKLEEQIIGKWKLVDKQLKNDFVLELTKDGKAKLILDGKSWGDGSFKFKDEKTIETTMGTNVQVGTVEINGTTLKIVRKVKDKTYTDTYERLKDK